jgi:hypothetical protein
MSDVLQLGKFGMTLTGLVVHGAPSLEEWEGVGEMLQRLHKATPWALGDWLNYGEDHYGEAFSQALAASGLELQTLKNYKWVAGKIEPSRRRDVLPFALHAEVASLPVEQQNEWLDKAEAEGMTRSELRSAIAGHSDESVVDELVRMIQQRLAREPETEQKGAIVALMARLDTLYLDTLDRALDEGRL